MKRFFGCILALLFFALSGCASKPTLNSTDPSGQNDWRLISGPRYVQGTMISVANLGNGITALKLKVEKNFRSSTDPVDDPDVPFPVGETARFLLRSKLPVALSPGSRLIVYEGQVTDGDEAFNGAQLSCYEKKGTFYYPNGAKAKLPPENEPDFI